MALVLTGFCAGASGGRVGNLYSAEVSLPGGSASALPAAYKTALREVLVKVTGRGGVAADKVVMDRFTDPAALVQQYRIDPGGKVWILFDQAAIRRILDQVGEPVWGDERPTTLVWMIMDAGRGEREMLASAPESEAATGSFGQRPESGELEDSIREILQDTADQRAIPIILPLVDSTEVTSISVSEVWGGFAESLLDPSTRYGTDAVLVGRAGVSSLERARVRWTLLLDGERFDWESDIAGGPNELADFFAARLATSIGASRRILLRVGEVSTLNDYGRVSNYLEALDLVEGFAVDRVADNEVIFSLTVRGDTNQLMRTIALRRVLRNVDEQSQLYSDRRPTFNIAAESLYYHLIPNR